MAGPSPGDSKPPTPTMFVWGRRYRYLGGFLGLILVWSMPATLSHFPGNLLLAPMAGAAVGTVLGMLAGALHDRMKASQP